MNYDVAKKKWRTIKEFYTRIFKTKKKNKN